MGRKWPASGFFLDFKKMASLSSIVQNLSSKKVLFSLSSMPCMKIFMSVTNGVLNLPLIFRQDNNLHKQMNIEFKKGWILQFMYDRNCIIMLLDENLCEVYSKDVEDEASMIHFLEGIDDKDWTAISNLKDRQQHL